MKCVQALMKQTVADRLEIIVVDNHSEDDSIGVLRNRLGRAENVRIIETPRNAGFSAGYNLGIRAARGAFLLVNNPTKRLAPDGLAQMVRAMEGDPLLGIVGPKLIQEDGTIRDSARAFPGVLDVVIKRTALQRLFPGRMRKYRQLDRDPESERDTDWAIGGCLLIRRSLLEKIGAFDPRFFLFFEDIDLCRRCWEAGFRVRYLPAAVASDKKRRLSEGSVPGMLLHRAGRAHVASAIKYFWKWRGLTTSPKSPTLSQPCKWSP